MIPQLKAKLEEAKKKISSEGYGNARFEDAVIILMPVIKVLIKDRDNAFENSGWSLDSSDQEILKLLEGK